MKKGNHSEKILQVYDNPKDVELTKRALQKANISNGIKVVEDGAEWRQKTTDELGFF